MINPLTSALEEIQAAKQELQTMQDQISQAQDDFDLIAVQPWELPEEYMIKDVSDRMINHLMGKKNEV